MKKAILNIVLLFIPLSVIIYSVSKYDSFQISSKNILNVNIGGKIKNLDYIFVGPSYVYSGINPAVFDSSGKRTFNLGVATAGPAFSELIIDDYLKTSQSKPKTIVLAISFSTFSDIASDAWDKYPIHRYLNFPLSNEYIFWNYSSSIDYIKLLRNSFKAGVSNLIVRKEDPAAEGVLRQISKQKGFSLGQEAYSYEQYRRERKLFLKYLKADYSFDNEKKILKLVDKYKKMNINVIIIEPPTFRLSEFYTKDYKREYEKMKLRFSKVNILILESEAVLDSTCFGNLDHLNAKGAGIYSAFLKNRLI